MIERRIDTQDRIILVHSVAEATRAEIDAHYETLRAMIAPIRAAGEPVRVLSDQTRAVRLSDQLSLHIRAQMDQTYRPGDRVALLMASAEDQAYARGVLKNSTYGVFKSRLPAEIWLMEPGLPPPTE